MPPSALRPVPEASCLSLQPPLPAEYRETESQHGCEIKPILRRSPGAWGGETHSTPDFPFVALWPRVKAVGSPSPGSSALAFPRRRLESF